MKIERTTTGVIIHGASTELKRKVLQYFSLKQPVREYFIYSGNDRTKKPLFGKEHDVIYISSGFLKIDDPVIKKLPKPTTINYPTPKKVEVTMNRSPRSKLQEDCIHMMLDPNPKTNKLTIELKPGTGKAEPYSRKIPTPTNEGYTLMGDLKVGDYVFDRKGQKTRVLQIFEQGEKDVYKVTFQDGRVAYCMDEHLWTVKSHKNGAWKTMMLKDMINDFKRVSPWKVRAGRDDPYSYKYYIPTCHFVAYPRKQVPIDPWVLGCFIGNGCLREKILTISSGTSEIPEKIARIYGFRFKKNRANYNYTFYHKGGSPVYTSEFFEGIPQLINSYSREKFIPDSYMINDGNTRLGILQGLMDTDGSISPADGRYGVRYSSTSRKLLEQIVWLLYSFGYSGSIINDKRENKYVEGYCGSVSFRVPNRDKYLFFTTEEKLYRAKEAVKIDQENIYDDLLIKDISFSHKEKCRCIMVDNPEHLYLTEDFIVTHNTFIATYATSKLGLKPLVVAPTTLLKNQWVEEFVGCGIPKEEIATKIWDAPNKKMCVVTISAIELELGKDWESLMKVINESSFGIKIVDEAHLHLKGMLRLDAICNIKHNWYLSATLGRSDIQEDDILNRALLDADRFVGDATYEEYQTEYINVVFQDVYYYPSNKLCQEYFKYGTHGLIKATYYNMLKHYKDGAPLIENIITIAKRARNMIDYGSMIMIIPLLDIIDKVKEAMDKDPYFKKYSYGSVDGSMKLSEKSEVLKRDIILSTMASVGTGVDVKGLSILINFDAFKSPITAEQCVGRLRRRKDDKECYYVDVRDHVKQARTITNWVSSRRFLLEYFPGIKPNMKQFPDIRK